MTARNYSSTASAKVLTANVTNVATQITLDNVTNLPTPPYTLVLNPDTAIEEIVTVNADQSGVSTPTLKVTRAQDGTTAQTHTSGQTVKHMITARDLQEPQNHINATAVHGATGAVVGTTNTQTLTNKTINLTSNTLTGTKAQFNSAMSDADFATLAGTETLTGKTINMTNNTISGTVAEFNTALSDGNFATLAGTETLTNKTITGGTVNATTLQQGGVGVARISGGSLITVSTSAPTGGSNGDIWLVY